MANYLHPVAQLIAKAGSTGNSAAGDPGLEVKVAGDGGYATIGFQFVVEAVGATPTVTFKYQGSLDGVTWSDVQYTTTDLAAASKATQTVTGTGTTVNFLADPTKLMYRFYRCVTTSNTNVTYHAEAYVFTF